MAEAMKLQKMKLMAMNTLQGNGSQNGTESEPDDLNSNTGEILQQLPKGNTYCFIIEYNRGETMNQEYYLYFNYK